MHTIKVAVLANCIALALVFVAVANAKPTDDYKLPILPGEYCADNKIKMDLCQKCAKITKSDRVYPSCCAEVDGVYKWCYRYVNYGI